MNVFVAGATGALGVPVVRRLVADGHCVTGLTRRSNKRALLVELGARAVVADALDAHGLRSALLASAPDAVVHALTAIPKHGPLRPSDLRATDKLRVTGTRNLLEASIAAGARRIVVESMVFVYGFGDLGQQMITEDRPPALTAPKRWLVPSIQALIEEETQVLEASRAGKIEGVVLRFGGFYGPRTGFDTLARMLRRRLVPLARRGLSAGVPWINIQDAASAMIAALYRSHPSEIYNVVDDHPARFADLVEHLATTIGAPRPISIPISLIRLIAPFMAAAWLDTTMKVSNNKARRALEWTPRFPNFKDGIAEFVPRRSRMHE